MLKPWNYLLSIQKNYFTIHKIRLGDCILLNFKHPSKIYLISRGCVKVSKIFRNNYILVFAILAQSDVICTQNIFPNYFCIVEALSSTSLVSCDYNDILYHFKYLTIISCEIISAYHRYIYKTNQIIQLLSHRDKRNRLINLLLILCKNKGVITKFGIIINLSITNYKLANIIGSSRITVNNIFNKLKKDKLISIWNNRVIIHDPISLSLTNRFFIQNFRT